MSGQPSLSKSRKAPPAPMVSGRYFLPKAPLVCLKAIFAAAVTSVNWMAAAGSAAEGPLAARAAARPTEARMARAANAASRPGLIVIVGTSSRRESLLRQVAFRHRLQLSPAFENVFQESTGGGGLEAAEGDGRHLAAQ